MVKRTLRRTPRKQLRAAAPRAAGRYSEDEYLVEEPNVKLSRAFVVVLLLHVVAVGGIFAFSALKDRQTGALAGKSEKTEPKNGKGATVQPVAMRESGTPEKPGAKLEAQKIV